MTNTELDQRIQKIADLLVDIAWEENDILQCSKKAPNVDIVSKVDPVQAEHYNYGSR